MNPAQIVSTNGASHRGRSSLNALVSGAAGAATVTLAHEVVRQLVPRAPRMDRLGMNALSRVLRALGVSPPRGEKLRGYTLMADLGSNALFYAPVALRTKRPWLTGLAMGAAGGLGAVFLTPLLGLPRRHRGTTLGTQAMTVALYAAGGLAAGAMASLLQRAASAGASLAPEPGLAGAGAALLPGSSQ